MKRYLLVIIIVLSSHLVLAGDKDRAFVHPDKDLVLIEYWETASESPSSTYRNSAKRTLQTPPALYRVAIPVREKGKNYTKYLLKANKSQLDLTQDTLTNPFIKLDGYLMSNGKYSAERPKLKVVKDSEQYAQKLKEWRVEFKSFLENAMVQNEDHELELLLYLKEFDEFPSDRRSDNWKRTPILRFISSISGLNDIRDAIPMEKNFNVSAHEYNQKVPERIKLPQVFSKNISLKDGVSVLASVVPRSCYYLEFNSVDDFYDSINLASDEFENWSPGTYPRSFALSAKSYIEKVGLNKSFLQKNSDHILSIAVAGWDPYFQSGTNILIALELKDGTSLKVDYKFQFQEKNALVLSSSPKLLKMAKSAFKQGKSLRQVDNFRYSRDRVNAKEGEDEKLFLYLSDFWLLNFVSPRWRIHTKRRNEADARIKMAHLLQAVIKQEEALKELPSIEQLRKALSTKPKMLWLLQNLKQENHRIVDKDSGGLFAHQPIDEMKFDLVSKVESRFYERFRESYISRWQKMDPLAFHIVEAKNPDPVVTKSSTGETIETPWQNVERLWKTRLYISPISSRSEFRELRRYVAQKKIKHTHHKVEGQAMGVSLVLETAVFRRFIRGIALPVKLQLSVGAFDFAPRALASNHLLEDPQKLDEISYARAPAFAEGPISLLQIGMNMWGQDTLQKSAYRGIKFTSLGGGSQMALYPMFVLEKSKLNGMAYLGLDPNVIGRVREGLSETQTTDPVACDLHFFIDFKYAYMMFRRGLYEALSNRALAMWRRVNRFERINDLIGLSDSNKNIAIFTEENVFPKTDERLVYLADYMPKLINDHAPKWGTSLSSKLDRLPIVLQKLRKIDLFISVEQNALFFEGHLKIKQLKAPVSQVRKKQSPPRSNTEPKVMEDELDFDFDQ